MGSVEFTVEGMEELKKALDGIPGHIRRDAMKAAIPPAGEIVREAVANKAPVASGRLKGSIVFRATQIAGEASGVVVPNRKKGGGGRHAHLVERGTKPHDAKYFGRPAKHPGQAAQPFFWSAAESVSDRAKGVMVASVSESLDRYWTAQGGAK